MITGRRYSVTISEYFYIYRVRRVCDTERMTRVISTIAYICATSVQYAYCPWSVLISRRKEVCVRVSFALVAEHDGGEKRRERVLCTHTRARSCYLHEVHDREGMKVNLLLRTHTRGRVCVQDISNGLDKCAH